MRGEVFHLHATRGSRGHEQSGSRYAAVVHSDQLPLPARLGKSVGFLSFDEMRRVDAALRIVVDL